MGLNQPFRAPVYQTYSECIRGLYNQGILGFYKGNFFRLSHMFLYDLNRIWIEQYFDRDEQILHRESYVRHLSAAVIASYYVHTLHLLEARMVLNNRIPAFQSYKSSFSLLISLNLQVFNGIHLHLPRCFIISLTGFNWQNSQSVASFLGNQLFFQTLGYPLLTIQRRLEC